MPKIYNTPGGDRPERAAKTRQMMIVVAVIVALLVIFLLFRFARGMEHTVTALPEQPVASSTIAGGDAANQ